MKLASYACDPMKTAGRMHKEKFEINHLNPFLKDRDRVIHSAAFRRLEYKTQVFVNHVGDHYRTRLTHTLEVSQVARMIARKLDLNEDLAETIALCHDLGHPPFGHAGEDGLNEAAKNYGGFDHNLQTVKVLTQLEQRYAEFDGLNLTWETIEGTVKHNGPVEGPLAKSTKQTPTLLKSLSAQIDLQLASFPSLEAQVAGLADDIAYCSHDIDDGIRAGMFKLEELKGIKCIADIYNSVKAAFPAINETRQLNETIRHLVKFMIEDLVFETKKSLDAYKISSPDDVRKHPKALVKFSPEVEDMRDSLKSFLMERVYRHYRVNRMTIKGKQIISELFFCLLEKPECLPTDWYLKTKEHDKKEVAGFIIDYIAGMTDRYAIEEHKKLFNPDYF
jgi:dGTPase